MYMLAKMKPPHACLGGTLNLPNMWGPGSSGSLQTGSSQQRLTELRGPRAVTDAQLSGRRTGTD